MRFVESKCVLSPETRLAYTSQLSGAGEGGAQQIAFEAAVSNDSEFFAKTGGWMYIRFGQKRETAHILVFPPACLLRRTNNRPTSKKTRSGIFQQSRFFVLTMPPSDPLLNSMYTPWSTATRVVGRTDTMPRYTLNGSGRDMFRSGQARE